MATAPITCTPDGLLSSTPCLACASDRQLVAGLALVLCKLAGASSRADCSVETLGADAACFACMSDRQMLEAFVGLMLSYTVSLGYMEADGTLMQDAACLTCADPKLVRAIVLRKMCVFIQSQLALQ